MFVDGENREALAAHIEEAGPRADPVPANSTRLEAAPGRARPVEFASDGALSDDTFGRPMDRPYLRRSSTSVLPPTAAAQASLAGYSEEYLASLSEAERARLLAGLEEQGMLSPDERERRSAALVEASYRRSGGLQANE
jgi:hypothetical protein